MKPWRHLLAAGLLGLAAAATLAAPATEGAGAPRVLRYSFPVAETGFDPAQISDLYSRTVTAHIFDGLYHYDHLARPVVVKPNTADGMPQVSEDFRTWTIRICGSLNARLICGRPHPARPCRTIRRRAAPITSPATSRAPASWMCRASCRARTRRCIS